MAFLAALLENRKHVAVEDWRRRGECRESGQDANEPATQRTYRGIVWSKNRRSRLPRFRAGSGCGDIRAAGRIFLEFPGERNLIGGTRRAWLAGARTQQVPQAFEDNPDNPAQDRDSHHQTQEPKNNAEHSPTLILADGSWVLPFIGSSAPKSRIARWAASQNGTPNRRTE